MDTPKLFDKILIANRGEVALRILRSARELGIATVVVYSQADAGSLTVQLADEAVCIGPAPSTQSYLAQGAIIAAALGTGAQAIHPGYGFLAENAEFADLCASEGIKFIGPSASAIATMGNKSAARLAAVEAGVPVVPGSEGALQSAEDAERFAESAGYPVLIKASAGGGGKGMREVRRPEDMASQFAAAKAEAAAAFGDDTVYLEKLLEHAKHIEFQIICDAYGNGVSLFERDCSTQRRHQKLIEEAPSAVLTPAERDEMGQAGLRLAAAVNYEGAGTVEFLYAGPGKYYFMEMNTRVQVEHPVTEAICGLDIVAEQIRVAAGFPLSVTQEELGQPSGHAFEFRINAEDPRADFRPSPGTITRFVVPGGYGVRVDTALTQGAQIPPYYDSMVAKLIAFGATREEALCRGRRALSEFIIEGVETTIPFHKKMLEQQAFIDGTMTTDYVEHEAEKWSYDA
ncbi:MAG: acetyl-CoA carboxylase biotin carboxylase subunit [Coriobacteriia bacterium]|nr:acetyl-CoA carboxylase biotin carboxylase subunit [Coriobacteriia bacterium]